MQRNRKVYRQFKISLNLNERGLWRNGFFEAVNIFVVDMATPSFVSREKKGVVAEISEGFSTMGIACSEGSSVYLLNL